MVRPRGGTGGGGQSGLAVGYFLRRAGIGFEILDASDRPGGAWPAAWESLRLFFPARWNSLSGWPMPLVSGAAILAGITSWPTWRPTRSATGSRCGARPVLRVEAVERAGDRLLVRTNAGSRTASAVVSATGGASRPFVPDSPGKDSYMGRQLHSSYRSPREFAGKRILVVGSGNPGAQILAELSLVAETTGVTAEAPAFLPDNVDGRALFERATERVRAQREGRDPGPSRGGLGDIVVVPPVREARDRGALRGVRPFVRFEAGGVVWRDGSCGPVDAVVWCTGFRPALGHLPPLGALGPGGRIAVHGGRPVRPRAPALAGRLRRLDRRRLRHPRRGDAHRPGRCTGDPRRFGGRAARGCPLTGKPNA